MRRPSALDIGTSHGSSFRGVPALGSMAVTSARSEQQATQNRRAGVLQLDPIAHYDQRMARRRQAADHFIDSSVHMMVDAGLCRGGTALNCNAAGGLPLPLVNLFIARQAFQPDWTTVPLLKPPSLHFPAIFFIFANQAGDRNFQSWVKDQRSLRPSLSTRND